MKLINKRNICPIICITYTIVSITLTVSEILNKRMINLTQINMFLFLVLSILGVGVLSQHYRFEKFSPLTVIIMQYVIAVAIIIISLWVASFFIDVHPDGYRDMTLSFSLPYFIGAIIYYFYLRLEVRKQNRLLNNIKKKKLDDLNKFLK